MTDDERTRKIQSSPEADVRTRLVRPSSAGERSLEASAASPATRLVGRSQSTAPSTDAQDDARPVVGWLVVVSGPGKGKFAAIFDGMNSLGRGADQATRIDFGDDGVSRSAHAFITYDFKSRQFYISHGGKSNIVRVNGFPVLQPVELKGGDLIEISRTILSFVPFCSPSFDWQEVQ